MDPTVISSIIGAAATLGAAIIGSMIAAKRARKKSEKESGDASERIKNDLLETFGYKIDNMISKLRMTNFQGSAEITKSYQGVSIIQKGVTVTRLPSMVSFGHPDGSITIEPHFIDKPTFRDKAVELEIEKCKDNECSLYIEVTGGLTERDPKIGFEYQAASSKGLCVTKEEMKDCYEHDDFNKEYFSYHVTIPIDIVTFL